ncbi:hypothetical protein GCM10020255_068020 [Rhodococcus baikonurensis]
MIPSQRADLPSPVQSTGPLAEGFLMDFRGSFDGFTLAVFEDQLIVNTAGKVPNDSPLTDHTVPFAGRLHRKDCNIDAFAALVTHETDLADYPYADSVADGVLLYRSDSLVEQSANSDIRAEIQDEIARALLTGPGITVFQGAFDAEILIAPARFFVNSLRANTNPAQHPEITSPSLAPTIGSGVHN